MKLSLPSPYEDPTEMQLRLILALRSVRDRRRMVQEQTSAGDTGKHVAREVGMRLPAASLRQRQKQP
jgi:hypothetical protein